MQVKPFKSSYSCPLSFISTLRSKLQTQLSTTASAPDVARAEGVQVFRSDEVLAITPRRRKPTTPDQTSYRFWMKAKTHCHPAKINQPLQICRHLSSWAKHTTSLSNAFLVSSNFILKRKRIQTFFAELLVVKLKKGFQADGVGGFAEACTTLRGISPSFSPSMTISTR